MHSKVIFIAFVVAFLAVWWIRKVRSYNLRISRANALLEEKTRELEKVSITDGLTGLYNRLKIDQILELESLRSGRYNRSLSIIMFDLDRFKQINDRFGHQAGDGVLREIATLVLNRLRISDTAGRWGGAEFLLICPETDTAGAARLAGELRKDFAQHSFFVDSQVTASFGVAEYIADSGTEDMIRRADVNLYRAKMAGKNKVMAKQFVEDW